jgi:hypothetical protein
MMPDTAFVIVCSLLVGLRVGSFGSGITRFAHEPSPKLPPTAR